MQVALIHHHFDADHLAEVVAQMSEMGAPTIKAVWLECHGMWAALEGCHRLRAAHALGLEPAIEEVEYSEEVMLSDVDCLDWDGEDCSIGSIADDAHRGLILTFED